MDLGALAQASYSFNGLQPIQDMDFSKFKI